jgi:hypothetical protein
MLRIPHCLDNWLTDGGKVVSLTHWPRSTSQKLFSASNVLSQIRTSCLPDTHQKLYHISRLASCSFPVLYEKSSSISIVK